MWRCTDAALRPPALWGPCTQPTWWDLSENRGVLEIDPPAAGHQLALEFEVLWGDGHTEPTLCARP